jgi:hypothetical protein
LRFYQQHNTVSNFRALELKDKLGQLEDRLRRWDAPVVDAFRPGASAGEVSSAVESAAARALPELVTWWGWHDGAAGPDVPSGPGIFERAEAALVDPWYVISLADAVRIQRWHHDDAVTLGQPELTMPTGWFPVLHFVGAAFLCVDTFHPGRRSAPLYLVDPPGGQPTPPPRTPQFSSLDELVLILIRLFDTGVVRAGAADPRVPSLNGAPLAGDVRRLMVW